MTFGWSSLLPALLVSSDGIQQNYRRDDPGSQGGFSLHRAAALDESLGEDCIQAMAANISCPNYVRNFVQRTYRGSLGNKALTDSICTAGCQSSLKNWFDSVATACEGKTLSGTVPMSLGGQVWQAWNETCVRDPGTKEYCNGSCRSQPHQLPYAADKNPQTSLPSSASSPTSRRCPAPSSARPATAADLP